MDNGQWQVFQPLLNWKMLLPTCHSYKLVQTFNLVLVGLVCHDIELASTQTWNLAKKCKMFLGSGKFVKN